MSSNNCCPFSDKLNSFSRLSVPEVTKSKSFSNSTLIILRAVGFSIKRRLDI